jgi:protein-disulfide isomerase
MSKKNRERRTGEDAAGPTGGGSGPNWLPIILAFAALGLGGVAWTNAIQLKRDTTKRLVDIDTKLVQLQTQVANAAKARPTPSQGPDPNKVYTVKTDGSPFKGNAAAPIVIAEFSEYQ